MNKILAKVTACLLLAALMIGIPTAKADSAEELRRKNARTLDSWMHSDVVLFEDGTVLTSDIERRWENWKDVVSVDAAEGSVMALLADGTVVSTTQDGPMYGWTNIVDVCGCFIGCDVAVTADGKLLTSLDGRDDIEPGYLSYLRNCTDVVSVEGCLVNIAVLHSDGTVEAWLSHSAEYYDLSGWTDIVQIAVSERDVYGLRSDGTVLAASAISYDAGVEGWTDVVYISAGIDTPFGIRADGTLLVGNDMYNRYEHLADWKDIAAVGDGAELGVRTDGKLVVANPYCFVNALYTPELPEKPVRLPYYFSAE